MTTSNCRPISLTHLIREILKNKPNLPGYRFISELEPESRGVYFIEQEIHSVDPNNLRENYELCGNSPFEAIADAVLLLLVKSGVHDSYYIKQPNGRYHIYAPKV